MRTSKDDISYEKDRSSGKPIVPVVNHPRKKTQEELWKEMLGEENLELKLIEYSG